MTDGGFWSGGHRFGGLGWLRIVGLILAGVAGVAVLALAFGYLVKLLWNWLMPPIFGLGTINYWQAFGIAFLAKLLFGGIGGFGRGKSDHRPARDTWRGPHHGWRRFWDEEGRDAFRRFMDRRQSTEGGSGGSAPPEGTPGDAPSG